MVKKSMLIVFFLVMFTLTCFAQAGRQITLQWDPNTESDLNHYNVYYGTASGQYGQPIDVGLETTYSMSLPTNDVYYFVVTAVDDSSLESDYSNEVNTEKPSAPSIKITVVVEVN
jgi:fibronectin type 3 domain-containing protein